MITLVRGEPQEEALVTSARRPPALPTLMYEIKQVELAVRARLDELLRPAGITAIQYTALTVLRHSGAMSAAALARHSFVTPQSMADLLATLQRRELITRGPDPSDRRRHIVALAPGGKSLLARYDPAVRTLEGTMVSALSDRQRRDLRRYLEACRTALS